MLVLRAKCVLLGDSTVGKTSLAQSFHSDGSNFTKNYYLTKGVDLIKKFINLGDNEMMDFFLYDCSGSDLFSELCENNWNEIGMFVIVFDLTNLSSFNNVIKWFKKISNFSSSKKVPGILVGNKKDLSKRRRISFEDAEKMAKKFNLNYFECSSKTFEGVEKCFEFLGKEFFEIYKRSEEEVQILQ